MEQPRIERDGADSWKVINPKNDYLFGIIFAVGEFEIEHLLQERETYMGTKRYTERVIETKGELMDWQFICENRKGNDLQIFEGPTGPNCKFIGLVNECEVEIESIRFTSVVDYVAKCGEFVRKDNAKQAKQRQK